MTEARLYLVAYDVSSPKRWRRVVGLVKKLGRRVQYSVFLCRATPRRIRRLEEQLRAIMNPSEDKLMIVDFGLPTEAEMLKRLETMRLPPDLARLGVIA